MRGYAHFIIGIIILIIGLSNVYLTPNLGYPLCIIGGGFIGWGIEIIYRRN